jgi:glycogen synthase
LTYFEPAATGVANRPVLAPEGDLVYAPSQVMERPLQVSEGTTGRPRRILMTTQTTRPAWDHRLELSGLLGRCGIDVALATLGEPPTNVQLEETLRIPSLQIFPGRFANGWRDDDWNEVERAAAWLLHLEEHVEPDIVQLDSYALGAVPFRAPKLLEGHHCPVCRDRALSDATTSVLWERYRQAVQCALRESRMVVTPSSSRRSHELTAAFGSRAGVPGDPARALPTALPQPGTKNDLILSAGCFGDAARALPALAEVARRGRVAGGGAGGRRVGRRGAGEPAHPAGAGHLARPPGRLVRAGVGLRPALPLRPLGLSALEAALAGCALVLGDVPSLRETWEGAALFVTPGDPEDLRRALDLLISEPKGLRGLAQRARTRALLLSPERRAAAFLEAYADVLRDRSGESSALRAS